MKAYARTAADALPSTTALTVGVVGAVEILHVHPYRVLELISAGAIPAGKVGRAWVMMTRDVLAYAEKVIIEQTAERLVAQRRKPTNAPQRSLRPSDILPLPNTRKRKAATR